MRRVIIALCLLAGCSGGNSTVRVFRIEDSGMLTVVGTGATATRPHFVGVLPAR